ncbi:hypothetical protein FIU97_10465 [Roseivivax sp. THAF40]|uniref:hypothetical protein n=1 Tax=unclassified Roseivivax TaxID=2639302 RepID=UPI0012690D9F|nr:MULTISPECIES: hypothetical protein [unclassified Roseivivax]QFS83250.1 hypothetical protein FIV09_10480 [Roseivivax sp. THAF197b]QFT46994.1 hypothetical protein FIU97_10465 [Roseivivax sp. THAF40]
MSEKLIALIILSPIVLVVIFAAIHEYRRYKSEGRATYGLAYDETTGTTYLTGIADDEEAFDPDEFDPSSYDEIRDRSEDETGKP